MKIKGVMSGDIQLLGIQYVILFFCVPFLKDSLFLISCCRNEQSFTQFPGLRSWERAPAWSLHWLPPLTSLKSDLLSYAPLTQGMQCFLALWRLLFAWLCFCPSPPFFFYCLKLPCMKIYKHAFLQTKHHCFTRDLGPLRPSCHWLQSPGPSIQRPWQRNR